MLRQAVRLYAADDTAYSRPHQWRGTVRVYITSTAFLLAAGFIPVYLVWDTAK